ncbi:hypothetical protein OHB00_06510 [Streptomyces sp. NBC_00631]|uniref:hypothetical protein n=1 Tax=Streptomyces sp. NBC_00631 TaxID=2975793 RepID=UPI0030DED2C9
MAAVVSWLEELERREAAARERIEELRARIAELTESLAAEEAVLSRLEITRETMSEILSGEGTAAKPEPETVGPQELPGPRAEAEDRLGAGSPVGVKLVPQWSDGLQVGVLPRSYQDIVEVLQDAVHPMRAHHLCGALGLSTDKTKVEGFRSKLKRLVERGWLVEGEPGLFAWRQAAAGDAPGPGAPERGRAAADGGRAGVASGPRP